VEEELLKRKGHTLLQAENGAQAVQVAVREMPDLILLDLQMPVMDGAKALALLRTNEKTSSIPVIMVTTIGEETQRGQLLAAGADRVLVKPINGPDFLGAIREILGD
jgi:two-component system cell cycle response regulator